MYHHLDELDEQLGLITYIQFFALNDGPGIRTTVFLKGCILGCRWCHNPEGRRNHIEVFPYRPNCTGCGLCRDVCPRGALVFDGPTEPRIDKSKCTVCQQCVEACPEGALVVMGKYVRASEVLDEVEKDKPFYKSSGGGMTVSGGEPLAQPRFTRALCKGAKEREMHVVLDTTAYLEWEMLEQILEYVNLVLLDIKLMDRQAHKDYTGVYNDIILDNARRIVNKEGVDLRIRVPVIPGVNDSEENLRQTAEFVESLGEGKVQGLDLLPYHPYAGAKYKVFGLDFPYPVGEGYNEEHLLEMLPIFDGRGYEVTVGG